MNIRINSTIDRASDIYKLINGAKPQDLVYRPYIYKNASILSNNQKSNNLLSGILKYFKTLIKGK